MVEVSECSLSVLIPAYNEASTVDRVIREVVRCSFLNSVVIVDDGSSDGTVEMLSSWRQMGGAVIALSHSRNVGKGAALRSGLVFAFTEYVVVQDADLEYQPADIKQMLSCTQEYGAQIVYGSRFLVAKNVRCGFWWHTFGNRLLTWFANLVTGQSLTDEATCYKLFRREVLERMNLQEDGFGFCPEVTAKASRLGIKIHEVPISYHPRTKAEGKKIRLWHGLEALWCLVYYTWFDRSLEPGAPRKPPAALKEVVRPPVAPEPEAVPVK